MSLDAMKQALEALYDCTYDEGYCLYPDWVKNQCGRAITALRAAIEQAQEPVGWMYVNTDGECEQIEYIENDPMPDDPSVTPLYTAPRQWQGLTDEDVKAPIQRAMQHFGFDPTQYSLGGMATIGFLGLVKEIEAKLKEKNT